MVKLRDASWASLWRGEDWWAVWLGLLVLFIGVEGGLWWLPRIGVWRVSLVEAVTGSAMLSLVLLYGFLLVLVGVASFFVEGKVRGFLGYLLGFSPGFAVVFVVATFSFLVARQSFVRGYGLEYVIWALFLGLLISNVLGVPEWLRRAVKTEMYIKVGLVLLGAELLFQDLLKAGAKGVVQALAVVFVVWYFAYFIARRLGLDKEFSTVLATGVSICGVSAAIAAGGAVKADSRKVSHVIGLVLLTAVVMLVVMPPLARLMGLMAEVAGAWIGGTIDTTPAVVAAGALHSEEALTVAAIVKMSQNVLIGVVAFVLALYWSLRVEKRRGEAPSVVEIWYRFPKFIIGFVLASIVFSTVVTPMLGYESVKGVLGYTKTLRAWLFSLAFVAVGLQTKFKDLIGLGGGKPAIAYGIAQLFNIVWTLIIAYIVWG